MSNKTPDDNLDETASAHSVSVRSWAWRSVCCAVLVAVIAGLFFGMQRRDAVFVELRGTRFRTEVMGDEQARSKGLSGRTNLDSDASMLFVFDEPGRRCFWMKDMQFSIDILWFDGSRRLIHQEHDVSPDSYPKSYCVDNAQYVLELSDGTARSLGTQAGDTMVIKNR